MLLVIPNYGVVRRKSEATMSKRQILKDEGRACLSKLVSCFLLTRLSPVLALTITIT
jgi:hypothetical protein